MAHWRQFVFLIRKHKSVVTTKNWKQNLQKLQMCVMYVNKVSAIYLSLETLTCRIKIYFNVTSQFCVQIKVIYPKQYYKNWETQMTHVLLLFLGRLGQLYRCSFSHIFMCNMSTKLEFVLILGSSLKNWLTPKLGNCQFLLQIQLF